MAFIHYSTQFRKKLTVSRREIFEVLQQQNIGVNVHYIPVYLQPYYQQLGYQKKDLSER
ncbi:hypothetical protein GCM10020331_084830 [Ectobacillus funiculus]